MAKVPGAPFSLEHPSQFYLESRKLRGGGGGGSEQCVAEVQGGGDNDTVDEFGDMSEKDLVECMDTTL